MPGENRNTISARNAKDTSNVGGDLDSYDSVVCKRCSDLTFQF